MRVSEFIEQCDGANAPDQVFEVYRTAAARFGYDRLALVPVTPPARQALGVAGSLPAVGIGANIPESSGAALLGERLPHLRSGAAASAA